MSLRELLATTRTTPAQLARLAQVHRTTAARWIEQNKAPAAVVRLLKIEQAGYLPSPHPSWQGWHVRGRWLVDQHGQCYEASEIRSFWLFRQIRVDTRTKRSEPEQLRLF